jgi:hypothetical protein
MGLNLKELVELALLDAVADHPVSLEKLLGAGAPWHELSSRGDVKSMMGQTLHRLLAESCFTVAETSGGTALVGAEAEMALQRAEEHPDLLTQVEIAVTENGKVAYKKLAHRYYNG